ncbi:SMC family ATPase [Arthrobacter sp. LAPM80]|uniref:AAA family ATPase n=1 Tax=Arthrobacter sp. LAPM80 TaxID=3141788 RepID=UPI00398ADE14
MRIHRLEIQAFGPFAGREIVDFDTLGAQGLFLLNGSTGAGKTSVLDAIAYALYGRVPGARQGAQAQLRSHHAAEGVGPEVVCEFSAGGRRLEVRRSPEWMRPAKRGGGLTKEQASTHLKERTADGWEVKSTRNDEAAAEIQELLGMNMAQFTKVVLLAQGDFAAFLRATAEERQSLLQKLFGTDIYKDLETRLAADSKVAQAAVAAGLAELAAIEQLGRSQAAPVLATHAKVVADQDEADQNATDKGSGPDSAGDTEGGQPDDQGLHGLELFGWLTNTVAQAVGSAAQRADASQLHSEAVAQALADADKRRSRHQGLESALAEQARLAELEDQASQWRRDQKQHHSAQVIAAVVAAAEKSSKAAQQARARVAVAASAVDGNELASAILGSAADQAGEPDLERLGTELTTRIAAVDAALPDEARHSRKQAAHATNEDELAQALLREESHAASLLAATLRLAEVQARQDELHRAGLNVEHAATSAAQAVQLVTAIEEHQSQAAAVTALSSAENQARVRALEAKEGWLDAFNTRLSQAAGELAAHLVDGEPCQVCGSTVHPEPSPLASTGADLVKAEKAAKKAFDSAETLAETARTKLAEARNSLAVLAERGGAGDLQAARDAVVLKDLAHGQAAAAVAELAALTAEAADLQDRKALAQAGVVEATRQAASVRAANTALAQEITELGEHLTRARDGYASLAARRTALTQAQVPGEALLHAVRQRTTAVGAAEEAATALVQALADSPFEGVAQVHDALLTPTAAAALDKDIKDHARALAVNADRLAAPEAVAAQAEVDAGVGVPTAADLTVMGLDAKDAATRAKADALVLGLARSAAAQLAESEKAFAALEADVGPLRERADLLAGLADAVRGLGENKLKMTLTSYVLAARLEQVAEAASARLATMSDARYTLRHTDAKSGNRKSGLGLEVVDGWTGISRDTSTLSGGESFMASLSLALGLSDVVQYESGGLDIETLFVDEGFGSLDEESLEQVMDALEGLRDGGRMIGLVSHVAEMKQRIPLHLHVHKGRHGSTLELTMAGAQTP